MTQKLQGIKLMKTENEFIKSIYLGDRICKQIIIDGLHKVLAIEVDRISRIRNTSGKWDFYGGEDIVNGRIVFGGLISFEFNPCGFVPSDWIEFIDVNQMFGASMEKSHFKATLSLGAIDSKGNAQDIILTIIATSLYLEDLSKPSLKITD